MYHDRVKILGGIDVDKIYKYESTVCNGCYDVLMMDFGLENIKYWMLKVLVTNILYGIWIELMQLIDWKVINSMMDAHYMLLIFMFWW